MICQDYFSNKQASVQYSPPFFFISIATQVKPSHILPLSALIYYSPFTPIQLPQLATLTLGRFSGVYQDTNISTIYIYIGRADASLSGVAWLIGSIGERPRDGRWDKRLLCRA